MKKIKLTMNDWFIIFIASVIGIIYLAYLYVNEFENLIITIYEKFNLY
jgi:hypothetical protein